jgi:hypothetical protein
MYITGYQFTFTAPLLGNGSYSIVFFVFIAAVIRLPSSCLAMDTSCFTFPAFGRYVTVCRYEKMKLIAYTNC